MGYTEKVDVLDLLINCLKEHEAALDAATDKLEKLYDLVPASSLCNMAHISGQLRQTGNSIGLLISKDVATRNSLKVGDQVLVYLKKVG